MGLFNRNKKKEEKKEFEKLTELPKLPRLPSLPDEAESKKILPQLPRYPAVPLKDKFSQNIIKDEQKDSESKFRSHSPNRNLSNEGSFLTNSPFQKESQIKEAVAGEKEDIVGADEFVREQMMPEHLEIKPSNKFEFPYKTESQKRDLELRSWPEAKTKKSGQVFIRIDKFEESLKIFEITKSKITEMEKLLEGIKNLKEKEEKELSYWMAEIQTIKNQTEKVERDIFSKLE